MASRISSPGIRIGIVTAVARLAQTTNPLTKEFR